MEYITTNPFVLACLDNILSPSQIISRFGTDGVGNTTYIEKPKQAILWNGGSMSQQLSPLFSQQ